MASKDEYFKRIIASLQADISSQNKAISDLKSTVTRQQKEIEALKASQKPQQSPSPTNLPSADKSQLLHQAKKECEVMIQTRFNLLSSRYVEKRELDTFRTSVSKTYLSTDTFTTYKKSEETRLKSIEEKLSHPFSLLTRNLLTHKGDHKFKNYFDLDKIISSLKKINLQWLISILVFLSMCSLAIFLLKSIND